MKRTVLFDRHKKLNAKIVNFAGYMMPISYSSVNEEHIHVRNKVGIFDVSHMVSLNTTNKIKVFFDPKLTFFPV